MIRKTLLVLAILLSCAGAAAAQEKGLGIGAAAGDPFGVTGKYWLDAKTALAATAGWRTENSDSFQLQADYLYHVEFTKIGKRPLPMYIGVGPRFTFNDEDHDDDTSFGPRFPIGLSYYFPRDPVELFAEVAPGFDIAPDTDFDLQWGVGFRFYLK